MTGSNVRITGLRELMLSCEESRAQLVMFMRDGLKAIAELVAKDVRARYSPYSGVGAAGVKAKVTRPGSALVAQTLPKSRDMMRRRPNFGPLMMKHAFLPAVDANEAKAGVMVEAMVDRIRTEHWEGL